MIVITGDCLSSGHEMLDPGIFKDDFKKLISLPNEQYHNTRLGKIYDLYLKNDPKYKKIKDKSRWVRDLISRKWIKDLEHKVI